MLLWVRHLALEGRALRGSCAFVNIAYAGLLAWLVYYDFFEQAGFFSQLVGHTYNELEQSFNTVIMRMMQHAIYTVSRMIFLIRHYLKPYGIKEVWELPNLWDVSGLVLPHTCMTLVVLIRVSTAMACSTSSCSRKTAQGWFDFTCVSHRSRLGGYQSGQDILSSRVHHHCSSNQHR